MNRRRRLGQHMLVSTSIASQVAEIACITVSDTVLEVGTGTGVLIPHLCGKAGHVISIEADRAMYEDACKKFSFGNLEMIHGDGFEADRAFSVFVSNLPYSASRTAIEWLCQMPFSHGAIMVQKEFASKLFKRDKAVSVIASHCMDIKVMAGVGRNNFRPPPRVDSAILAIRKKRSISRDVIKAVNLLFSYRRKTISGICERFGIHNDVKSRLDEVSTDSIITIAEKIAAGSATAHQRI